MGCAYLAARADGAYEKQVAIKLIKRGMDSAAIHRRFRHERQILANLHHPNIAALLDGGTADDGRPYLVMDYVEGLPIDEYCEAHALPTAERLMLFQQVCAAVHYAHRNHVIHRDLKPSNVLVSTNGTPVLLDFGVATLLDPERTSHTHSTLVGRMMTPQYASPEQVRGQATTCATDIYSLGVLLYELVTSRHPFRLDGRSVQDVHRIICDEEPDRPSRCLATNRTHGGGQVQRQLAGDVDMIVLMALRKEPERRYATAEAFAEDIQRHLDGRPVLARPEAIRYRAGKFLQRNRTRVLEGILGVLLLTLSVALTYSRMPEPRGGALESVAVLPFINEGNNPDTDYLSEGMTESIIDGLSGLPNVRVMPLSGVTRYRGPNVNPQRVGTDLNVRAVLVGTIAQRAHGRLLVGVELVNSTDGRQLWREEYDRTVADVLAMNDEITRGVANRLQLGKDAAQREYRLRRSTESGEAYHLYLKGRYLWNKRTESGFWKALDYFAQAIDRDARYAQAYTGLADCYNLLGIWGALAPRTAMPKVKEAAMKAIAIDDSLAEAHASLAFVRWVYDWDWRGAEEEFRRALQLNPNYVTAHQWYAYFLASRERFDEALAHITRAQELEPVSQSVSADVGEIYYWARRYDPAIDTLNAAIEIEPGFAMARNILGLTYLKAGRLHEALQELEAARALDTGPRMLSTLGHAYGLARQGAKAQRVLDDLMASSRQRYTSSFALAVVYAGLGDNDQAFRWLEQAYTDRSDSMVILNVYPVLDGLRHDPRFADLLERVGLTSVSRPARSAQDVGTHS